MLYTKIEHMVNGLEELTFVLLTAKDLCYSGGLTCTQPATDMGDICFGLAKASGVMLMQTPSFCMCGLM